MNRALFILFFIFSLLPGQSTYAYGQFDPTLDGLAKRWSILPVQVIVDAGTLFGKTNGFTLIQQAVGVWNSVKGVPTLLAAPVTSSFDYDNSNASLWNIQDGVIRVIFDEGGAILSSNGMDPTSGLLGIGLTIPDTSGFSVGGLVVINGHPSANGLGDLLGTIIHEFGHVLGLTHTPVGFGGLSPPPLSAIPTMYPFAGNFDMKTLELDDILGIRAIYAP